MTFRALGALLLVVGWGAALPAAEPAERAAYVRSHYAKFEARIPMRDGVRLFTSIYVPNDRSQAYPFLLVRTPYGVGPYGASRYKERLGPSAAFEEEGFIFVFQDVRGRYMSEGEFVNMRPERSAQEGRRGPREVDESTDSYDTVDWLLAHVPGNNRRVGMWGISYPGFYSAAGMIDSHPALKAVSPQAPIADWFWDDMHRHGAFVLPLAFRFFSSFGKPRPEPTAERVEGFDFPTPDGYGFYLELGPLKNVNERYFHGEIPFWNELAAHPDYDAFWQSRNLLPHLRGVGAAVLVVGGWFDTEDLYGPLHIYRAVEQQNPGAVNTLVMGPWPHGGWQRTTGEALGGADFGFPTSRYFQDEIELPFFLHHLKDAPAPAIPEALVFETGANRWRRFDAWPPAAARDASLYLSAAGGLSLAPPAGGDEAYDEYVSDPAKPVPYTMEITNRWARDYMTEDQRFAAWRPDVLVYQGDELAEDLTVAGPLEADLWVSTSGSDADWIVKLIDVLPGEGPEGDDGEERREEDAAPELGGTQRLVRAEAFRGRFRESYEHPRPFVPGEVTHLTFALQDVFHTFQRGHRVMVQVQSSWFPFIDRNPQRYVPNIFAAEEADFIRATQRVYRSAAHPSRLRVQLLP